VNDLYKENYKPLKKEIEEDYRRWKDLPCSMDWENQHSKNGYTTKTIFMFNGILIKIPVTQRLKNQY
jgi:hypothetical protein